MEQELYKERTLFVSIAEGDEVAFTTLFELYIPQLHPVILQIVHSESVVKDVIQDVFLRLWLARERLPDIEVPKSYLFRMAYNQAFKHLRKQINTGKAQEGALQLRDVVVDEGTPEIFTELNETRRIIAEAISILPDQSRNIYRLNRIEGYKPAAIAEQLGISTQSVRNSLTRSNQTIREHLSKHGLGVPMILLMFGMQ